MSYADPTVPLKQRLSPYRNIHKKFRPCIRCGRDFKSKSPAHRRCRKCTDTLYNTVGLKFAPIEERVGSPPPQSRSLILSVNPCGTAAY